MYRSQSDAIKEWLKAYRANEERIDKQLEKIRMLRSRMMSVGAQRLSYEPKGGGSGDQLANYVIQLESLEASVKRDIQIQDECKKTIQDIIKGLEKAEERKIIEYRYLCGYEWNDVLEIMYRREPKYGQKIETYRRKMYRAHEDALQKMAKRWSKNG